MNSDVFVILCRDVTDLPLPLKVKLKNIQYSLFLLLLLLFFDVAPSYFKNYVFKNKESCLRTGVGCASATVIYDLSLHLTDVLEACFFFF